MRFLASRYAARRDLREISAPEPIEYPETGLYHPRVAGRIATDPAALPGPTDPVGVVGLLVMRSYVLAGDTAHYDAVIEALEARGLRVLPAFAAGLDCRPAVEAYFEDERGSKIDVLASLTGFSLVGGPAYHDGDAAATTLSRLDAPYVAAHALEFQSLDQWRAGGGLGPVETTMLVALPEIDGATNPIVFGARDGADRRMTACAERVERLAARVAKLVALRRARIAERRVAVVLYGFPPNAGAAGTAAHLSVFESLLNTLRAMRDAGYDVEPPESVEALREAVLEGDARRFGQEANVAARIPADDLVAREPHLAEIEAAWGPAPGRHQSDGGRVRARRAVRERLRRRAAGLRLRGRSDAPSVRKGLRADARL